MILYTSVYFNASFRDRERKRGKRDFITNFVAGTACSPPHKFQRPFRNCQVEKSLFQTLLQYVPLSQLALSARKKILSHGSSELANKQTRFLSN